VEAPGKDIGEPFQNSKTNRCTAEALNISSKLGKAAITAGSEVKAAANVYSTVTKDLTLLWNTEEPTPPRIWRLLDEGLEVLSYIPFTYKSK